MLVATFFSSLMPMQTSNSTLQYDEINFCTQKIPDCLSAQSKTFLQTHVLFAQLEEYWGNISSKNCITLGLQLESLLQNTTPAVRNESLYTLIRIFFYHRPFNVDYAITLINIFCSASPTLIQTIEEQLGAKGVNLALVENLKPHQKLILFFLAHHATLVPLMTKDYIDLATSDDIILKLIIAFNLTKELYNKHHMQLHTNQYAYILEIICSAILNNMSDPHMESFIEILDESIFDLEIIIFYDDLDNFENYYKDNHDEAEDYLAYRWRLYSNRVAALAGSSNIFNYLALKNKINIPNKGLVIDAIYGNNYEIIEHCINYSNGFNEENCLFLEENCSSFLEEAIKWHRYKLINRFNKEVCQNNKNFFFQSIFLKNIPYFLWFINNHLTDNTQLLEEALCSIGKNNTILFAIIFLEMNVNVNCCVTTHVNCCKKDKKVTPLFAAILNENIELVNVLLNAGASIKTTYDGKGVLHKIFNLIKYKDIIIHMKAFNPNAYDKSSVLLEMANLKNDCCLHTIFPLCTLLHKAGAPLDLQFLQEKTVRHRLSYTLLADSNKKIVHFLLHLYHIAIDNPLLDLPGRWGISIKQLLLNAGDA